MNNKLGTITRLTWPLRQNTDSFVVVHLGTG